jgi:hypothetical protein
MPGLELSQTPASREVARQTDRTAQVLLIALPEVEQKIANSTAPSAEWRRVPM